MSAGLCISRSSFALCSLAYMGMVIRRRTLSTEAFSMRKHLGFLGRSAAFLCILGVCIMVTYQIITPKICYDEMLSTTLSYVNFYDVKRDTTDVLFLGSSLAATACIPQEMYDLYGIRSYNLASEKQSPVISYYWLKEALRFQSPKIVVMDCNYLFQTNDKILNTTEDAIWRSLDYMKWSPVKLEAIRTICGLDEEQSFGSYLLPNIRYHERWAELTEEDFSLPKIAEGYDLKGYAPLAGQWGGEGGVPYEDKESDKETAMLPLMERYLNHIERLCEEEGIALVLINVPQMHADAGKYQTMQKYAEEYGVPFYDFNEKTLYTASGYDFSTDSADAAHTNLWGAKKITACLGNILEKQYGIGGNTDEQWEQTKESYAAIQKDCELIHMTDIDSYIEALRDDRYSVFLSAKGGYAAALKDSTVQKLRQAGFEAALQTDASKEDFYCYYAVLSDGQVEEYIGYDQRVYGGSIRNGRTTFEITGGGSILIDGKEVSRQGEGLNIVVFHNQENRVLDSVCFDTSTEKNAAGR